MSGTIWLIVEDEEDKHIAEQLLIKSGFRVRIRFRQSGPGGISRLQSQLEELIREAINNQSRHDCIAVLHDWDEHKQSDRAIYTNIEATCKRYPVKYIVIPNSIEAWLLADAGLCKWLEIKQDNWDTHTDPKHELNRLLKDKKGIRFQGPKRTQVLSHLTGNTVSPSLREALRHLENAPCTR